MVLREQGDGVVNKKLLWALRSTVYRMRANAFVVMSAQRGPDALELVEGEEKREYPVTARRERLKQAYTCRVRAWTYPGEATRKDDVYHYGGSLFGATVGDRLDAKGAEVLRDELLVLCNHTSYTHQNGLRHYLSHLRRAFDAIIAIEKAYGEESDD